MLINVVIFFLACVYMKVMIKIFTYPLKKLVFWENNGKCSMRLRLPPIKLYNGTNGYFVHLKPREPWDPDFSILNRLRSVSDAAGSGEGRTTSRCTLGNAMFAKGERYPRRHCCRRPPISLRDRYVQVAFKWKTTHALLFAWKGELREVVLANLGFL